MDNRIVAGKLPALASGLIEQLEALGYADKTLRHYASTLGELKSFMDDGSIFEYCEDVGLRFIGGQKALKPAHRARQAHTVIRRLDDVLANRGYVKMHTEPRELDLETFSGPLGAYLDSRKAEGRSQKTIYTDRLYAGRFLLALQDGGIDDLRVLDAHGIRTAFTSMPVSPGVAMVIRRFLRFVFEAGYTDADYSPLIPHMREPRRVPSVYAEDEVKRLLQAVDRTTAIGKRDYAMLLIAALLGLRAGDIVTLKAENIDCGRNVISLIQSKTKEPIELPLADEVKEAIAEYLKAARPKSGHKEVFLGSRAPYRPIGSSSLCAAVAKYFKKAEVDTANRRHGPHSLRASLATRLLEEDVPYGAIQKVLGHRSALSAKAYLDIDIERLRACALDVLGPTGLFAERLAPKGGIS
ncbi:MAG: tyrosine-type recombinase/integrase [Coriobacteriales bacterium]|jgi:integrase|nr:tyrosine-type recombinase/integrase [Coriobacteriales bacterium]